MKKVLIISVSLAIAAILSCGCKSMLGIKDETKISGTKIHAIESGEGFRVYQVDNIDAFTAVRLEVYCTIGKPTGRVRVEGSEKLLEYFEARIDGSELNMKEDKSLKRGNERLKVYLTIPMLKSIDAVAGSIVDVSGLVETESLDVDAVAGSKVALGSVATKKVSLDAVAGSIISLDAVVAKSLSADAVAGSKININRGKVDRGELDAVAGASVNSGSVEFVLECKSNAVGGGSIRKANAKDVVAKDTVSTAE